MRIPLRVSRQALRRAFLRHGDLFAQREGREGHAERVAEDGLGGCEDGLEVPRGSRGEDFGADVGTAEGLAGVLAREGQTDELLDHLVVCAAGVGVGVLGQRGFVVGAGRGAFRRGWGTAPPARWGGGRGFGWLQGASVVALLHGRN